MNNKTLEYYNKNAEQFAEGTVSLFKYFAKAYDDDLKYDIRYNTAHGNTIIVDYVSSEG